MTLILQRLRLLYSVWKERSRCLWGRVRSKSTQALPVCMCEVRCVVREGTHTSPPHIVYKTKPLYYLSFLSSLWTTEDGVSVHQNYLIYIFRWQNWVLILVTVFDHHANMIPPLLVLLVLQSSVIVTHKLQNCIKTVTSCDNLLLTCAMPITVTWVWRLLQLRHDCCEKTTTTKCYQNL